MWIFTRQFPGEPPEYFAMVKGKGQWIDSADLADIWDDLDQLKYLIDLFRKSSSSIIEYGYQSC